MTVDPRTLTAEVRAEATGRASDCQDPYDRARAAERALHEALHRARARMWAHCHWWGLDAGSAPER